MRPQRVRYSRVRNWAEPKQHSQCFFPIPLISQFMSQGPSRTPGKVNEERNPMPSAP